MKVDLDKLRAEAMNDSYPVICAVYFLFSGDELVYIGQSQDVYARARHHYTRRDKEFDTWAFIEVRLPNLLSAERSLIQRYRPKYNIAHIKKSKTSLCSIPRARVSNY